MRKCALVIVTAVMLAGEVLAQTSTQEAANQAFTKRDWAGVVQLYGKLTSETPESGLAWYRLGRGLQESGRPAEAVPAFKRAVELKFQPFFAQFYLAVAYAQLNDRPRALAALEESAANGFQFTRMLNDEQRLAGLRDDPRYKTVAEQIAVTEAPCKDPKHTEYRDFDFWVGDWDVFDRSGQQVGTSSVKLILKDCVVYENWAGGLGTEGKSFNKYNPWQKQWEQYWVDEGPDRMFFAGHRVGDEMRFETDAFTPQGQPIHRKLTFYKLPDGTVRQFSQATRDGGKTYAVEYDFIYKRKGQSAGAGEQ